ncbi:BadF/BadG/BcrA/BcrD ATPase family protein [Infirmifilum sp. NZ]|uniref:BadF/BadG/BcrA/BcrD ATPase family protein n=1 Tax=Infirmifilum sp. NZ TaxID=2926850 RepID=UPI00279F0EAF|nr:BadF/BadG/BcrA/BcrD ATPase family protein [Infirmifilum sp. NZ]UNQ73213.1 hypothetical protein MOV14_08895 [Infirmifilum sp. NZ]
MSMKFLLVDIGKTKTVSAVVGEELELLGLGFSGPADVILEEEVIVQNLSRSHRSALESAQLDLDDLDLIVLSWAGLDTREQHTRAKEIAERVGLPADKTHIIHDALAALYAVTLGRPGVAVIAGTGAIAIGLDAEGRTTRSSGWGWLIGDEGSGAWIALQALNSASRAYDGRGPWTSLVKRISDYFGVHDLLEIIDKIYLDVSKGDISKVAGISRIVDEEAQRGDEISRAILVRAGKELALSAVTVADRLGLEAPVVGEVGSVFKSRTVWEAYLLELKEKIPNAIVKEPYVGSQALVGCLVYAMIKSGREVGESLVERLRMRLP